MPAREPYTSASPERVHLGHLSSPSKLAPHRILSHLCCPARLDHSYRVRALVSCPGGGRARQPPLFRELNSVHTTLLLIHGRQLLVALLSSLAYGIVLLSAGRHSSPVSFAPPPGLLRAHRRGVHPHRTAPRSDLAAARAVGDLSRANGGEPARLLPGRPVRCNRRP